MGSWGDCFRFFIRRSALGCIALQVAGAGNHNGARWLFRVRLGTQGLRHSAEFPRLMGAV